MRSSAKKQHGGYRTGAGRKPEAVKTKSRRIPEDITNDDIKLIAKYKRHSLPLYEMKVENGVPSITSREQFKNHIAKDQFFVSNIEDHFMVKVSGCHLKESGILENDILLVNQNRDFQHNNIVIATTSTGNAVLKKLIKEGNKMLLVSDNDNCPDIEIDKSSIGRIWGVVTRVIRDIIQ